MPISWGIEMNGFYLSRRLDGERVLCVAPLTDRNVALSGQEVEDLSGYFLFEKRGREDTQAVEILAHMVSEEAALRMGELLKLG
jgi:hypothetical protein